MEKEIVRLRQRTLSDGKVTLYLDIYLNGKRNYEFLKLYLYPEKTRQDKMKNKETMLLAKSVQAKRLVEIQQGRFDFEIKEQQKVKLLDYYDVFFKDRCEKYRSTHVYYNTLYNKLKQMPNVYLHQVDAAWINKFVSMNKESGVGNNSMRIYLQKLSCYFNYAVRNKILKKNPCKDIQIPTNKRAERNYLTIDELRLLMASDEWKDDGVRAFVFSCLTGFRYSDVRKLTWSMIQDIEDACRINIVQTKTGNLIYQDISREARKLMGERRKDTDHVFRYVQSLCYINKKLKEALKRVGITKHISFHCSRHTFALLLLDNSVDIYTVSKLLGHTDVKTTQIYAHILDKKKQEAVNSLPSIFD